MSIPNINVEQTLVLIFFVTTGIQLFYYLFFYLRIAMAKDESRSTDFPPVSIIICARNQKQNLERFLDLIFSQDYREFEVVVVNDCSGDGTETYLAQKALKEPRLQFRTIVEDPKFKHGKKLALSLGIKAAKYETFLFTDADCYPPNENWIKCMTQHYADENIQVVLGYGGYEEQKGILNKLIRFDTFFIGLNYLGFAMAGLPYMGVGRNLSYKKRLYDESSGFTKHYNMASGDDDLFVNEVARRKNTAVEVNPLGITKSSPKTSYRHWVVQKTRHLTTGRMYKKLHVFLLGLEPFSRMIMFMLFALYFIYSYTYLFYFVLGAFILRLVIQLTVFKLAMNRLNEKNLLLYSPLLDMLLPIFYVTLGIKNFVSSKRKKWK